jgi:hypothetical protein
METVIILSYKAQNPFAAANDDQPTLLIIQKDNKP